MIRTRAGGPSSGRKWREAQQASRPAGWQTNKSDKTKRNEFAPAVGAEMERASGRAGSRTGADKRTRPRGKLKKWPSPGPARRVHVQVEPRPPSRLLNATGRCARPGNAQASERASTSETIGPRETNRRRRRAGHSVLSPISPSLRVQTRQTNEGGSGMFRCVVQVDHLASLSCNEARARGRGEIDLGPPDCELVPSFIHSFAMLLMNI